MVDRHRDAHFLHQQPRRFQTARRPLLQRDADVDLVTLQQRSEQRGPPFLTEEHRHARKACLELLEHRGQEVSGDGRYHPDPHLAEGAGVHFRHDDACFVGTGEDAFDIRQQDFPGRRQQHLFAGAVEQRDPELRL